MIHHPDNVGLAIETLDPQLLRLVSPMSRFGILINLGLMIVQKRQLMGR
jgi:hypothetical protein